jgi:GxxExxY protein
MKLKPRSANDPITHAFIGHAMKVHSAVGPGLNEEIYHQELVAALTAGGVSHLSKPRRDLVYRGIVADTFEPDFVVENHFIPELKCLRGSFDPEHLVQVFCYCKFWRIRTSLVVDFGKQSLMWTRFIYSSQSAALPEFIVPDFVSNPALAERILHAVSECLNEVGLGYRQTTWKGLVSAAIRSAGIKVHINPTASVLNHPHITMPSLVIDDACALFVTALTDGINATDRASLQTHLRWLNLDWGIVFHFGKNTADFCFVQQPRKNARRIMKNPTDSGRPADYDSENTQTKTQSAGIPESAGS